MPTFPFPTIPSFSISRDTTSSRPSATGATIYDMVNQATAQMTPTPIATIEHNWDFLHYNPLIDTYASAHKTISLISNTTLMMAPLILYNICGGLPTPCMCIMHPRLLTSFYFPVLLREKLSFGTLISYCKVFQASVSWVKRLSSIS